MEQFICEKCDRPFKLKADLKRHMRRKNPCKPSILNASHVSKSSDGFSCKICGYSTRIKQHFIRHLNKKNPCKKKSSNNNEININMQFALQEINDMKQEIHDLKSQNVRHGNDQVIVNNKPIQTSGFIYIIHLREFINTNTPIYKIGRSVDMKKRLLNYPKNSVVVFTRQVDDNKEIEKEILNQFDDIFEQEKDYGREYYSGDKDEMIDVIHGIIKQHKIQYSQNSN